MTSKKASAPGGSTTGSGSATNTGESPPGTTTAGITSMDSSGSTTDSALLSSSSSAGSWADEGVSPLSSSSSGAMVWGSDQAGAVQTEGSGVCNATAGLGVSLTAGWAGRLAASAASKAVTSTCRDESSSLNRVRIYCRESPGNASGVKASGAGSSALFCSVSTRSVMP